MSELYPGLSVVWLYVDGALAAQFAVEPSLVAHSPYMTGLNVSLPAVVQPSSLVVALLV